MKLRSIQFWPIMLTGPLVGMLDAVSDPLHRLDIIRGKWPAQNWMAWPLTSNYLQQGLQVINTYPLLISAKTAIK